MLGGVCISMGGNGFNCCFLFVLLPGIVLIRPMSLNEWILFKVSVLTLYWRPCCSKLSNIMLGSIKFPSIIFFEARNSVSFFIFWKGVEPVSSTQKSNYDSFNVKQSYVFVICIESIFRGNVYYRWSIFSCTVHRDTMELLLESDYQFAMPQTSISHSSFSSFIIN